MKNEEVNYDLVLKHIQNIGGSDICIYNAGDDTIQFVDSDGCKMYILIDEEEQEFCIEDEDTIIDSDILTTENIISALDRIFS